MLSFKASKDGFHVVGETAYLFILSESCCKQQFVRIRQDISFGSAVIRGELKYTPSGTKSSLRREQSPSYPTGTPFKVLKAIFIYSHQTGHNPRIKYFDSLPIPSFINPFIPHSQSYLAQQKSPERSQERNTKPLNIERVMAVFLTDLKLISTINRPGIFIFQNLLKFHKFLRSDAPTSLLHRCKFIYLEIFLS